MSRHTLINLITSVNGVLDKWDWAGFIMGNKGCSPSSSGCLGQAGAAGSSSDGTAEAPRRSTRWQLLSTLFQPKSAESSGFKAPSGRLIKFPFSLSTNWRSNTFLTTTIQLESDKSRLFPRALMRSHYEIPVAVFKLHLNFRFSRDTCAKKMLCFEWKEDVIPPFTVEREQVWSKHGGSSRRLKLA